MVFVDPLCVHNSITKEIFTQYVKKLSKTDMAINAISISVIVATGILLTVFVSPIAGATFAGLWVLTAAKVAYDIFSEGVIRKNFLEQSEQLMKEAKENQERLKTRLENSLAMQFEIESEEGHENLDTVIKYFKENEKEFAIKWDEFNVKFNSLRDSNLWSQVNTQRNQLTKELEEHLRNLLKSENQSLIRLEKFRESMKV